MPNLRIVSDNAVDRASSIVASSVAGLLAASNLQTHKKSSVWRASGTSASLRAVFASAEAVGFVGLPFCNLSPTATMRVRATNELAGTNLLTSNTDRFEVYGNPPASVRYVLGPDGQMSGVVPISDSTSDRWEISIPANTYPNGTVLVLSWFQKTVVPNGSSGQAFNVAGTVGGNVGTLSTVSGYPNGYSRKWYTFTVTATAATQFLRLYMQGTVGADDLAACCWQLELGTTPTSYYPALATFTSRTAGVSTFMDINGYIASAASGAARMQYQYPSLAAVAPRLLVEQAATNLMLQSSAFGNAVYTKTNTSVGVSGTGPDGTASAPGIVATAGSGLHHILQAVSVTAGTVYTYSIYVRPNGRTRMRLSNGTLGAFADFNLGTTAIVGTGGSGYLDSTIEIVSPDWRRITITFLAAATSAQSMVLYLADNTTGSTTYVGTGTTEVFLWGWQLEAGYVATSHIPTTTVAVTRAADVVSYGVGARPGGYIDWWQSYSYDSGAVLCCPAPARKLAGFSAAQAASAYSCGGGAYARLWLSEIQAIAIAVDLVDYANPQGYLEAARMIAAPYWSPSKNASYGPSVVPDDTDENYRTGAGDLITDVGIKFRKMQVSLDHMSAADRKDFFDLVRGAGKAYPLLISLFPESSDLALERDHMIYGKLSTPAAVAIPSFATYASSVEIEEV